MTIYSRSIYLLEKEKDGNGTGNSAITTPTARKSWKESKFLYEHLDGDENLEVLESSCQRGWRN
jgi:hypothetical protein